MEPNLPLLFRDGKWLNLDQTKFVLVDPEYGIQQLIYYYINPVYYVVTLPWRQLLINSTTQDYYTGLRNSLWVIFAYFHNAIVLLWYSVKFLVASCNIRKLFLQIIIIIKTTTCILESESIHQFWPNFNAKYWGDQTKINRSSCEHFTLIAYFLLIWKQRKLFNHEYLDGLNGSIYAVLVPEAIWNLSL